MSETVQFWLDNKMSTGTRVAAVGDQLLVSYRDRFYVVVNGAALAKGGKAQQFSKTSLPALWKKAMRGILPIQSDAVTAADEEILPLATTTTRARVKKDKIPPVASAASETSTPPPTPAALPSSSSTKQGSQDTALPKQQKTVRKAEPVQSAQESAVAECPYCGQRHDLTLDKRKNGKPFFVSCTKCAAEFAVRFVQVSVYQAQVAGFR